jgi:transposase
LFEHAIIDLLKASKNQTKTAQIMRCGFNVVNRAMHLSTKRVMERRNYTELVSAQLSIDEKAFKNGHNYVTVLSHPGSGCVLDVEEHRTKEACKSLFSKILTETQLGQVTTISMDIRHGAQVWPAYITTAEELLPNAAITHDRFHLIMHGNKAIDQVRRREVKRHDELKNTHYALLKNPENLTEKQRIKFESIIGANYEVSRIGRRLPGRNPQNLKAISLGFWCIISKLG